MLVEQGRRGLWRHRAREPERLPNGLVKNPPALPPLLRGARRWWITVLVMLGLTQAGLAALSAWALVRLQAAPAGVSPMLLRAVVLLVLTAVAVGMLKVHERVVSEKLGQHYVHQLRLTLLTDALTPGHSTSLGVTVARTTNDLSGVRNWVSQGVAPLVVATPLIGGSLITIAFLDQRLALALAAPLVLLGACLLIWARSALVKTRELRRRRGRLAARIADTVVASDGILASGGTRRELRNIEQASDTMVQQAIDRAETVGAIRSAGIVAATMTTLLVAAGGVYLALEPGVTMAAMAVVGIASTPMLELGRIVEYRQSFLAARMVLGPAMASARRRRDLADQQRQASAAAAAPDPEADAWASVHVDLPGITAADRPLRAGPGDRIRLVSEDPDAPRRLLRRLLELDPAIVADQPDSVWVSGENLRAVPLKRRRELVGYASSGTVFERGSVARALHYRRPDLGTEHDQAMLDLVGLDVSVLPQGARTSLRHGGEPLNRPDRARLALARALYGSPPLLLIDNLEGDLDDAGRMRLQQAIQNYPGVVILAGSASLAGDLGAREYRLDLPLCPGPPMHCTP